MKLRLPALAVMMLLLVGADKAPVQTGTIDGWVIDKTTRQPLAYANVVIVGANLGTMTLEDGHFQIANVPVGQYTVKAAMMGYGVEKAVEVKVEADKATVLVFELSMVIVSETQAIMVMGKRSDGIKVQSSPSVTRTGKDLHVRGGRSGEAQSQIHGAPVDDPLTPEDESKTSVRTHRPTQPRAKRISKMPTAPPVPAVPPPGSEQYDPIYENEFVDPIDKPMSTFSVDVDAASYANVRRFVRHGSMPPRDAVRVEELINYFNYDYPEPEGDDPFSINTEVADCPWRPEHRLVHIGLQGKRVPIEDLPPANLVFLIDVSGSMRPANKLPLLKNGFRMLTDNLREEDRVAIVTYAGRAGLVLDSTPGDKKEKILEAINQLGAGGSTAGAAGIQLAYEIAEKHFMKDGNNRVILATDGDFNVGVSHDEALVKIIEEKRKSGVFLSVLGFGEGNLKDAKMEKLADKGNGNYHYIDDMLEARRVLVHQMGGTLFTIAKDVKIQLEFNPAKVSAYRLIGYENRLLAKKDFDDDKKDAGDIGSGHSVTALYEIVPAPESDIIEIENEFRYFTVNVSQAAIDNNELLTVRFRYKQPDADKSELLTHAVVDADQSFAKASEDFRFAAAVAEFGMLLRGSEYRGDASWSAVIDSAKDSKGRDPQGYRAEFVRLAEACRDLGRSTR